MSRRVSKDSNGTSSKRVSLKPVSNRVLLDPASRRTSREPGGGSIQNIDTGKRRSYVGETPPNTRRTSHVDNDPLMRESIQSSQLEEKTLTPQPALEISRPNTILSQAAEAVAVAKAEAEAAAKSATPAALPTKPLPKPDPSWLAKRTMCVGLCVFDIFHVVDRYPDEDTKLDCAAGWWARGGNPSNSCTVLSLLGARCEYLGMLSTQPAFRILTDDLHRRGIITENCPGAAQDPPFASVILEEGTGTRTIVVSNSNFPNLTYEHFKKVDLNNYNWIHFEGRNPEETGQMIKAIRTFNEGAKDKIQISLELERLSNDVMVLTNMVDYVFLGKELALFNGWNDAKTAAFGLRDWISEDEKPAVIVTWGSQGADCLDSEGNYARCHGVQIDNIVDSCGAGDTFLAAVIFAMVHLNLSLKHAIEYSNMITAYKLQHKGYDALEKFKRVIGGNCHPV